MGFSSAIFLFAFLPLVFLASRLPLSLRAQNLLLAAASLVFYAFGQLRCLPLLLLSVLINYLAGLLLCTSCRRSRPVLILALALNLGLLGLFKYADFAARSLNALGAALPLPGLTLPIGISFYTFQGLSYVIDCYRDPEGGTRSFLKLLLYLSFFPQLIAGPIVKYHDFAPQIDSRRPNLRDTERGWRRFIRGLAKKLLIADALGAAVDPVFSGAALGDSRLAWLGAVCYLFQIYYDFSGYSDMAIGMAGMFGFRLRENFLRPYAAADLRDFWRRWHVSLSGWFREYLYFPLGGSRRGRLRTACNRLLVFFCTGLWHGADWTFVVWGLGHGLLTVLEGLLPWERLQKRPAGRLLCRGLMLLAVTLLFVVFRAESLAAAGRMLALLFSGAASAAGGLLLLRLLSPARLLVLFIAVLCAGTLPETLSARWRSERLRPLRQLGCVLLLALSLLSLAKGGFQPFIYFRF